MQGVDFRPRLLEGEDRDEAQEVAESGLSAVGAGLAPAVLEAAVLEAESGLATVGPVD